MILCFNAKLIPQFETTYDQEMFQRDHTSTQWGQTLDVFWVEGIHFTRSVLLDCWRWGWVCWRSGHSCWTESHTCTGNELCVQGDPGVGSMVMSEQILVVEISGRGISRNLQGQIVVMVAGEHRTTCAQHTEESLPVLQDWYMYVAIHAQLHWLWWYTNSCTDCDHTLIRALIVIIHWFMHWLWSYTDSCTDCDHKWNAPWGEYKRHFETWTESLWERQQPNPKEAGYQMPTCDHPCREQWGFCRRHPGGSHHLLGKYVVNFLRREDRLLSAKVTRARFISASLSRMRGRACSL